MREPPNILQHRLRACLEDQYNLVPLTIEYLPRGQDYSAGVFRVVSEQGTPYLLKVKSGPLYEPGCLIPHYLSRQGITSVVAPIPTRSHTLWTSLKDWSVILYPFVDGNSSLTGMTDKQWQELGTIFQRIHRVQLLPEGFRMLRKATFDPAEYVHWVHVFETQHLPSVEGAGVSERALHTTWMARQSTIDKILTSLASLGEGLRSRTLPYVICHADLHPANLIRDSAGRVFVIDWDDVMLAPKERDFIFVREPQAKAFWKGYGPCDIDRTALAYFLWERVVQDLIEYAREVCFGHNQAEYTKAELARRFRENLEGPGALAAAASASHLGETSMVTH